MNQSPNKIQSNCGSFFPIVALGVLACIAGAFHNSPLAIAFGLPTALGPALLFFLIWKPLSQAKVIRELPSAAFENDEIDVSVVLENHSKISLFFPIIIDHFTPEYHATKKITFPFRVAAKESVKNTYVGRCLLQRGLYRLGPITLVVSDPFGWIQLKREFPFKQIIKVYPTIQPCGNPELQGTASDSAHISQQLKGRGSSTEFIGVREYRVGDPRRFIHWPLTARHGQPVVREHAQPRSSGVEFLIDLNSNALLGTGRGSSLEHSIKLSLSLADEALRRGASVGFHAQGKHSIFIPSGRGLAHGRRLLDSTVSLKPNGERPLDELLHERSYSFDSGSTVIYPVSPYLFSRAQFLNQVRFLSKKGFRQIALVFDEKTFRAVKYEESGPPSTSLEYISQLSRAGAEARLISCGAPFQKVMMENRSQ